MRKPKKLLNHVAICLVNLIFIAVPALVLGQVTHSQYSGFGDFVYTVQSMPDLDQQRNGLPDDGNMYCLPTAGMNLVAYAANFGFPELPPYQGTWQGATDHDEMTTWLSIMGNFMNTDSEDGTSFVENFDGLKFWVGTWSFSVNHSYRGNGYWPNIDGAAFHASNGAIVSFRYGRYLWIPNTQGTPVIAAREGGHSVTLQHLSANTGNSLGPRVIYYRNPGSDEEEQDGSVDLNSNSQFTSTAVLEAKNLQVLFDADNDGTPDPFIVTALNDPPVYKGGEDVRYRFVDEVTSLYPPAGFSYTVFTINPNFVGGGLGFVNDQHPIPFNAPSGESIISVIPHPESHSGLALVSKPGEACTLYQTPHGNRATKLITLPAETRCLALGFGHAVYACTDRELVELRVLNGTAERVGQVRLPARFGTGETSAMTYHDQTRQVIIAAGRYIHFVDTESDRVRSMRIRGMGSENIIGSMTVLNNRILVTTERNVVEAMMPAKGRFIRFRRIPLRDVTKPFSVDVNDRNRLFVCDERSGLKEFEFDQRRRAWHPVRNPLFANVDCVGKRFVVLKSHTNVRPGQQPVSEWFNIHPDDLAVQGPEVPD